MSTTALRAEIASGINNQTAVDSIPQTEVAKVFVMVADLLDAMQTSISQITIFPNWVQGTYNLGDRVTRNSAFYESQVANNTADPLLSSVNWKPLADVLVSPITAQLGTGGSVGGINTSDIIPARSSLQDIAKLLLTKKVDPIYSQPTLSLTSALDTQNIEVGDVISVPLVATYVQNDAGARTSSIMTKNGNSISANMSYTDASVVMTDVQNSYRVSVNYAAGTIKNDNLGNADSTGSIASGAIYSNILIYKAYRNMFWGFGASPVTSDQVRALGNKVFLLNKGQQININVPVGATRVIFAYNSAFGDVTSVKYVELANSEVKGNFTVGTQVVAGSNGNSPINYTVMIYTPVEPFTQSVNYLVTI